MYKCNLASLQQETLFSNKVELARPVSSMEVKGVLHIFRSTAKMPHGVDNLAELVHFLFKVFTSFCEFSLELPEEMFVKGVVCSFELLVFAPMFGRKIVFHSSVKGVSSHVNDIPEIPASQSLEEHQRFVEHLVDHHQVEPLVDLLDEAFNFAGVVKLRGFEAEVKTHPIVCEGFVYVYMLPP